MLQSQTCYFQGGSSFPLTLPGPLPWDRCKLSLSAGLGWPSQQGGLVLLCSTSWGAQQWAGWCPVGSRKAEEGILIMKFSGPNTLLDEPELLINSVMCSSELDDFSGSFSLLFSKILLQRQLSFCWKSEEKKKWTALRMGSREVRDTKNLACLLAFKMKKLYLSN